MILANPKLVLTPNNFGVTKSVQGLWLQIDRVLFYATIEHIEVDVQFQGRC